MDTQQSSQIRIEKNRASGSKKARRTRERPKPSGSKKNKVAKHKRILFKSEC